MTDVLKKYPEAEFSPHKISRLSNSFYYFFDVVLLLQTENNDGYRLIIHHSGVIMLDSFFATVRGARIAFTKYCCRKAFKKEVRAEWTQPYHPEKEWLEKILTSPRAIMIEDPQAKAILGAR